ncbi:carbohydrate ABC transporter substrate-binding protein, CUT1 family (TC 3.A.1.1.-) [Clostridium cavendishii DSM 21758]|uniref:Carbohydrate ABC transporter substrate-binding protein, CUT1 family (TC 3.A.1.1.-) n=1 Tax=Clostridium cavendishii DSM 21758 TaxID=1121302 RepID=A0A1M6GVF5_9CLOT|nr:extracellular solute-binding protein [Clostridium cavendishii]SHJ13885.1 carbohydrate ABC transporter substrate-binding protein, CUT1 family (TC 3.A.1.1.-) [Clostridium cavendishii DSM 21758]
MKGKGYRKILSLVLVGIISSGFIACSKTEQASGKKDKVKITYPTYRVGAHASAAAEKEIIDEFNKKYGDEIEVVVEELPSDQAYVEKMKVLAASKQLPDIVEGKNGIIDLAIKNGQAVDLLSTVNGDEAYKAEIGEEAIKANMRDGKLYSIANARQLIGYFYNKEMFKKAGINPAKTWDEFMSNNQKLKDSGVAPLALMTGENAWTSNLILGSIIGTDGESGNKFMNTMKPADYSNPSVIKGLTMMQKMLKEYTTKDAIGAMYANAANNFSQEKAAIIANGPWMTPDFSDKDKSKEGLADRVGVALYPEDGIVSQYEIGYMVCTSDKAKSDAAMKFLKFKTGAYAQKVMLEKAGALPLTDKVEMSEDYKKKNPLIVDLIKLSSEAKHKYSNLDNTANPTVMDVFAKLYPDLALGNITPEKMAEKMTEAAAKSK